MLKKLFIACTISLLCSAFPAHAESETTAIGNQSNEIRDARAENRKERQENKAEDRAEAKDLIQKQKSEAEEFFSEEHTRKEIQEFHQKQKQERQVLRKEHHEDAAEFRQEQRQEAKEKHQEVKEKRGERREDIKERRDEHREKVKQLPVTLGMACERHGLDADLIISLLNKAVASIASEKRAAHPQPAPLPDRCMCNVNLTKSDFSTIREKHPIKNIEKSGFARSVSTKNCGHFTLFKLKRNILKINRLYTSKCFC